jgi:hypothetical protein
MAGIFLIVEMDSDVSNSVDDEVADVAAWTMTSSDLLMDGELLLMNSGVACPLD